MPQPAPTRDWTPGFETQFLFSSLTIMLMQRPPLLSIALISGYHHSPSRAAVDSNARFSCFCRLSLSIMLLASSVSLFQPLLRQIIYSHHHWERFHHNYLALAIAAPNRQMPRFRVTSTAVEMMEPTSFKLASDSTSEGIRPKSSV